MRIIDTDKSCLMIICKKNYNLAVKTTGLSLVLILLAGSLVAPIGFSVADTSSQTVPAAPTNLSATAMSGSQINLSWTAPVNATSSQVNGYKIEVSTGCTGIFSVLVANTTSTATTYSNTGLISGICYQYRASAINPIGVGNPSNTASATTFSEPSAPRSLNASAISSSQINLSWLAPSSSGGTAVNGYKIERRNACTGSFITIVANTSNTNTAFSNTGLTNGTCYQYRVYAHNAVDTSAASNNATATTLQAQVPTQPRVTSAPTGLNVTSQSISSLKLTWTAPADQGSSSITGYRIQRNGTMLVNNTGSIQTSYIDLGLLVGHQQTYRVAAWNAAGLGSYSNEAAGKPTNQTSTAPADIKNLGQIVSDFVHRYNALIKQQREDTIKAIKECNEKVRNATSENRKQVKEECKKELKALGEKNREARRQFQQEFKEFRDNAKSIIKVAKENKTINKEDVKEFKQELKSFQKEAKKDEKDFAKEIKEIKKDLAHQEKELKKELKEHKKEDKKSKKPKHDEKED